MKSSHVWPNTKIRSSLILVTLQVNSNYILAAKLMMPVLNFSLLECQKQLSVRVIVCFNHLRSANYLFVYLYNTRAANGHGCRTTQNQTQSVQHPTILMFNRSVHDFSLISELEKLEQLRNFRSSHLLQNSITLKLGSGLTVYSFIIHHTLLRSLSGSLQSWLLTTENS